MQKGYIYLVNFDPSTGKEFQKTRPALIIQSENIKSSLVTIIPLSSQVQNKEQYDVFIQKDKDNRLFSDSLLKVKQISSFDKQRCIHFIGYADKKIQKEIDKYLLKHFDI
ncbi:type II toxin-antitoxin system PemK/MazF family toxin [Candidatus Peregrinibacteria bacterium]|jgi:mRNA interferase MazF|nr:type II toxin-antitoxin system PemK/MazF family toxin [Candidatus Peregrinibacteria bacterium]